jgi:hypothetical protein
LCAFSFWFSWVFWWFSGLVVCFCRDLLRTTLRLISSQEWELGILEYNHS